VAGIEAGIMAAKIHGLIGSTMLFILEKLFSQLKQQQIQYCLFKSNQHLHAALAGETDIDMLINQSQMNEMVSVLNKLDFIKMKSPREKTHPFMDDYAGFDEKTGQLIHLHLNSRLIFGSKYMKNYIFPDESYYLNNSVVDSETQVMIARPDMEIRLLCLRIFSKIPLKVIVKNLLNKKTVLSSSMRKEVDFLISQLDKNLLSQKHLALTNQLTGLIREFISCYQKQQLTNYRLLRLKSRSIRYLKPFRVFSGYTAMVRLVRNRCGFMIKKRNGKLKKYIACPAPQIAFLGVDGAGKSTVIPYIKKWLNWKLRVKSCYLGKPRPKSVLFLLLNKLTAFFQKRIKGHCYWLDVLYAFRLVLMARQRVRLYKKALKQSYRGFIILFNRFPLSLFYYMNNPMDGPKIKTRFPNTNKGLLRYLAEKEIRLHLKINLPKRLIVLKIDLNTALSRKPENHLQIEQITEKIAMINYLLASHIDVCPIDAVQPLEQVLLQIKQKIWTFLTATADEYVQN
jgi:thymidylate kinase